MHAHLSQDTPVGLPASMVWDLYRGLKLGRIVDKLLPNVIGRVETIKGYGGIGTIVKVTFPTGSPINGEMIERFVKVDDENRVKVTEVIEGGYKALGFDVFRFRFEILEKDCKACIIRSSIEYEIDDELEEVASRYVRIKVMKLMAETSAKHLISENKSMTQLD